MITLRNECYFILFAVKWLSGYMTYKEQTRKKYLRPFAVLLAAVIMSLNIKIMVRNGGLYPGGATGLTVLTQTIFEKFFHMEVSYTIINIIFNAIPAYIGFKYIGKNFTIFSIVMILLNSVLVDLIPKYELTSDILLISIFGGMLNGLAISLCLMVDATTGGTDFISIFLSDRFGIDGFNLTLGLNAIILITAGILFGWDKALYSIIFQYVSTQTIHLLYRTYQQVTLFIISNKTEEIADMIHAMTNHGATILNGEGAYQNDERKMIYSVINASSEKAIIANIRTIDPKAFVNCIRTKEIKGNFHQAAKD